jgi:small subunit ribosomal protein S17
MSDERNARKAYQGRVVSDKMDKTITVVIDTYRARRSTASGLSTPRSTTLTTLTTKPTLVILFKSWKRGPLSAKKGFRLLRS